MTLQNSFDQFILSNAFTNLFDKTILSNDLTKWPCNFPLYQAKLPCRPAPVRPRTRPRQGAVRAPASWKCSGELEAGTELQAGSWGNELDKM
jgi:hypothetical protein